MSRKIIYAVSLLFAGFLLLQVGLPREAKAQDQDAKAIFTSIGNDLASGNEVLLAKWFAENLEVDVLGEAGECSKNQARQLIKNFYKKYAPKGYYLVHVSGSSSMRYGIGTLLAGGERFRVTIFIKTHKGTHTIQQLRIEKE